MALLIACSSRGEEFAAVARGLAPNLDLRVAPDVGNPADIRYALAWWPQPGLLKSLPNLQLIVSVGAGVDHLFSDPDLPEVPIVRFVDPDLTGRMVEYVALHVLYHHRRMSEFRELQARKVWKYLPEPAAHEVRVGLMGLGVLGSAAADALKVFGYRVRGWSRSRKSLPGVACHAGEGELDAFLAETDILAVLLPLTPDTRGTIDRALIAKLSRRGRDERLPGPVLINAGRGGLQVDAARMSASRRTTRRRARPRPSCAMPCAKWRRTATARPSTTWSIPGGGIEGEGVRPLALLFAACRHVRTRGLTPVPTYRDGAKSERLVRISRISGKASIVTIIISLKSLA